MLGLADCLAQMRPDLLLVIADRYEMLAPASVALAMRIPLAHIEGGEISEGAIDDCVRNALTRLSHVHFTSTEQSRARVTFPANPAAVAAGSVYVLKLMGITLGGWMLARSAEIASRQLAKGEGDPAFLKSKILTARFFADHVMSQAASLATAITRGSESVLAVEEAML